MNPQLHDEFVALTALFYAGELTDEEWALLQVHLAYCDSCRMHFEQYRHLATEVIPSMAVAAGAESPEAPLESVSSFEASEQRLLSQLNLGRNGQKATPKRIIPFKILSGVLAASTVGLAALLGALYYGRSTQSAKVITPSVPMRVPSIPSGDSNSLGSALGVAQNEIATLRKQLKTADDRAAESKLAKVSVEGQLQSERAQAVQLGAERDALNQQLATVQVETQSLKDKSASAISGAAQNAAQLETLEDKVNLLNVALVEKERALDDRDRMLSADKDFLAHDRDIRDVIGARNLYIADIFDTGVNGKTAKPFGRIFYTQDRSLIFYGFDLDKQPGLEQAAAFQVWGNGSDKQTVNLGLFYQDDSHKRWVLRCNDPKMLARLNMVFVTVEPPGGSKKPTGKQLLRAYLQIQPNHP